MAPKKKVVAATLEGCTVAISGTFADTNHATIQGTITSLGASVAKTVTADTNMLISTPSDVAKTSTKVKGALKHQVPIVSLDWLDECASSLIKQDVDDYLLNAPANAAAPAAVSKGKKRAISPDAFSPPAPAPDQKKAKIEPKFGEGSLVKSRDVVIPLDEYCPLGAYRVYVDEDGVIYDAALNQTNASNNNNKFYRIQLLYNPATGDHKTWTRWGRVGDRGQNAILGSGSLDDAVKQFDKKFKDKSGLSWDDRAGDLKKGKYAYLERSYGQDDEDEVATKASGVAGSTASTAAVSRLAAPVQSLMQLIFNQQYMSDAMTDLNYDANKLPLGKLSKATINRGFQALADLMELLSDSVISRTDVEDISNRYYSLVPHNFGRNRPPVINSHDLVKRELQLLESLVDMKEAAELMKKDLRDAEQVHMLDRQFKGLGLNEMTVLDSSSVEYKELASYLVNTRGATHSVSYAIENIFRIERGGEVKRFEKSVFSKVQSDRRLLWHGSRATNFGGILSQGLRIAPPEAPVSGYMFGKGIYLADMSSKSANYCCAHNSGGHALLLLCEAELGAPMHTLTQASYNAGEDAIAKGMYSTWGKGLTAPPKWKDAGSVHPSLKGVSIPDTSLPPGNTDVPGAYLQYNEFIAYDIAQVRLRYLFRVRI